MRKFNFAPVTTLPFELAFYFASNASIFYAMVMQDIVMPLRRSFIYRHGHSV